MDEVTVFGKPFAIVSRADQYIGRALAEFGYWEPINSRFFANYFMLHPDSLFCDVGANAGYFAVLAAEASRGRCRVMAFEPEPQQYACLVENVTRRDLTNVRTANLALGNHRGEAQLMRHRRNLGDHRLWPGTTSHRDNEWNFEDSLIPVQLATLDAQLAGQLPDVVKIDVQGYEYQVLEGMRDTLARIEEHFFMVCEWTPKMLRVQGTNPDDLLAFLHSFGLRIYVVGPGDNRVPVPLEEWARPRMNPISRSTSSVPNVSLNPQRWDGTSCPSRARAILKRCSELLPAS